MRLSDAIDTYLERRAGTCASKTVNNDRYLLLGFLSRTGNILVKSVNVEHVERFFYSGDDCLAKRLNAASFNMARSHLRSFFRWCVERGLMKSSPMGTVVTRKGEKRERLHLSADQVMQLIESAPHPRDRMVIALGANTALRASEVTSLRIGDVDLDQGTLRAKITKSRIEDYRPITSDLDRELRRWLTFYAEECGTLDNDWYLCPAKYRFGFLRDEAGVQLDDYQRLRPTVRLSHPHEVVQRGLARMGLPTRGEGLHTLRRSVGRLYFDTLRDEGYDGALQSTKALLNHRNASTTELYLGLDPERRRRDESLKGKPFLSAMVDRTNVTPIRRVEGT